MYRAKCSGHLQLASKTRERHPGVASSVFIASPVRSCVSISSRINTCKSVSKQTTSDPVKSVTYAKLGRSFTHYSLPTTHCFADSVHYADDERSNSFIYRYYAELLANPFIDRIYANTPGVCGS
jgi:hypothetical protein